jgi:ABC-type spermidine/putrescine transport system permease subunit II
LGVALAWQFLFLAVSADPLRYRLMMLPCILEKISYGITLAVLFAQHRIPLSAVAIGSGDWIFAALFLAAYVATTPRGVTDAVNP